MNFVSLISFCWSVVLEKLPMDWCWKLAHVPYTPKQSVQSVHCDSLNVFVMPISNKINIQYIDW